MNGHAGRDERPLFPVPLARPTRALFRALSRARGKRIFHPFGVGFEARLELDPPPPELGDVELLRKRGPQGAVVRLSRALGLPATAPDVLGIAVRVLDSYGPGRHQDFLLVSAGRAPLARHAFLPGTRGFFGHSFSSLLLYDLAGWRCLVGLEPAQSASVHRLDELRERASGLAYRLVVAPPLGGWTSLGRLKLGRAIADRDVEPLRFTPWNTGGGIRPFGPLAGLREPAYEGSHLGRAAARRSS